VHADVHLGREPGRSGTFITHPASLVYPHNTDEERRAAGISPGLIRMPVGAEDIEDIIGDLDMALA
jgi:O-acetylhomoserine/O-acetylserine sulfhydrylase-like pyridoxal-dependent enzyme